MKNRGTGARGDMGMRPRREHDLQHIVLGHERLHLHKGEWMELNNTWMIAAQKCSAFECKSNRDATPK